MYQFFDFILEVIFQREAVTGLVLLLSIPFDRWLYTRFPRLKKYHLWMVRLVIIILLMSLAAKNVYFKYIQDTLNDKSNTLFQQQWLMSDKELHILEKLIKDNNGIPYHLYLSANEAFSDNLTFGDKLNKILISKKGWDVKYNLNYYAGDHGVKGIEIKIPTNYRLDGANILAKALEQAGYPVHILPAYDDRDDIFSVEIGLR